MNTGLGEIRTGDRALFQRCVFMRSGPLPSGHPGVTSRQEETAMDVIDLNCDMGESFGAWTMGSDAEMLKIVSSANVACGFHGGDPLVMFDTVSRAKENRVGIGAHPSFFDVWGFGRRQIQGEKPDDIQKMVVYQIGALQAVARAVGHRVGHIKAHGTLANLAAVDRPTALAIGRAIAAVDRELIYVVMAGTELERAAHELGLRMAREIYADRAYDDTGNLVSRKLPGAVLHDPEEAAARVSGMVREGAIISNSGKRIPVSIDTVCVHGDNPAAVAMAAVVRERLEGAGIAVRPMAETIS
jgi:5-oxoprolinase (ATP-hydrolysing) subunit A